VLIFVLCLTLPVFAEEGCKMLVNGHTKTSLVLTIFAKNLYKVWNMKKELFILLFLLHGYCLYSQGTFESLLDEHLVWTMKCQSQALPDRDFSFWTEDVVLRNDTLIDGIPFKRAYLLSQPSADKVVLTPKGYLIGQKGGMIFQKEEDGSRGSMYYPIMDFSLDVGEEFVLYENDPNDPEQLKWVLERFLVTAVSDTVIASSTDKRVRRCLWVRGLLSEQRDDCWVEGIGSLNDGIIGLRAYYYDTAGKLEQCMKAGEVLYSANSVVNIHTVERRELDGSTVYDLQGRRLNSEPRSGLYIRDGKKYVRH